MSDDHDNDPEKRFRSIRGGKHDSNPLDELAEQIRNLFRTDAQSQTGGGGGGDDGDGGNGNGNGRGPLGNSKLPDNIALYAAIAIIVAIAIFSSFYTVDVSEEAVVTRFEKYERRRLPACTLSCRSASTVCLKCRAKSSCRKSLASARANDAKATPSIEERLQRREPDAHRRPQRRRRRVDRAVPHRGPLEIPLSRPQRPGATFATSRCRSCAASSATASSATCSRPVRVEIADEAKLLTQEVLDRYDMGIIS